MYSPNEIYLLNAPDQGTTALLTESPPYAEPFSNEAITDIYFYYGPIPNPEISITFLILKGIIILIGEFLNNYTLKFLKLQDGLVNDILKMFLRVQMVYWPVTVLFSTTTDFFYPLRDMVGAWYCNFGFLWIVCGMTLVLFHSFIVGLMRYVFVVHNERVVGYGKERAKKLFFLASIMIPVFVTLWGYLNGRDTSAISSLNKCNGVHHQAFLIENSIGSTMKRNFCVFEKYEHDPGQFLATIGQISCKLYSALYVLMGFNVVEGLLYWRTVTHANR